MIALPGVRLILMEQEQTREREKDFIKNQTHSGHRHLFIFLSGAQVTEVQPILG